MAWAPLRSPHVRAPSAVFVEGVLLELRSLGRAERLPYRPPTRSSRILTCSLTYEYPNTLLRA